MVPGFGTRPWYQALCVMLDVVFILDVADVMLTGCPWRETDGIRLWPCRKYETLQPGENNLTWADTSTRPSETLTLSACPVLSPQPLSIMSRTWRFPLLYSREDTTHWRTPKTWPSSWLRWVMFLQEVEVGLQKWTSSYFPPRSLSLSLGPPVCLQVSNLVFHQHIEHWEHVDFIWGLDAPDVMFPNILKLLKEHN